MPASPPQMPGFSLALSEVMSNMWDPYMPNIRCGSHC